jgi:hypothetical protein
MAGQPRVERAGEMVGNMFYTARDIIRAQASTELGSIQQHRLTLEEAPTDQMKVSILRIMAEELRHGYQMFWVFDHDESWRKPGHPDVAKETMDELLRCNSAITSSMPSASRFTALDNVIFTHHHRPRRQVPARDAESLLVRTDGAVDKADYFRGGLPSARTRVPGLTIRAVSGSGRFSIDIQEVLQHGFRAASSLATARRRDDVRLKDHDNGTAQAEYYGEVRGSSSHQRRSRAIESEGHVGAGRAQPRPRGSGHRRIDQGVSPRTCFILIRNSSAARHGGSGVHAVRRLRQHDHRGRQAGEAASDIAYLKTVLPHYFVKTKNSSNIRFYF